MNFRVHMSHSGIFRGDLTRVGYVSGSAHCLMAKKKTDFRLFRIPDGHKVPSDWASFSSPILKIPVRIAAPKAERNPSYARLRVATAKEAINRHVAVVACVCLPVDSHCPRSLYRLLRLTHISFLHSSVKNLPFQRPA